MTAKAVPTISLDMESTVNLPVSTINELTTSSNRKSVSSQENLNGRDTRRRRNFNRTESADLTKESMENDLKAFQRAQFFKTRLCTHFTRKNHCGKGANCNYAHDQSELKPSVDLTNTKLCSNYLLGKCSKNDNSCGFAHGLKELRATTGFYKTQICKFWLSGKCPTGNQCRHAHGTKDCPNDLAVKHVHNRRSTDGVIKYKKPSDNTQLKNQDTKRNTVSDLTNTEKPPTRRQSSGGALQKKQCKSKTLITSTTTSPITTSTGSPNSACSSCSTTHSGALQAKAGVVEDSTSSQLKYTAAPPIISVYPLNPFMRTRVPSYPTVQYIAENVIAPETIYPYEPRRMSQVFESTRDYSIPFVWAPTNDAFLHAATPRRASDDVTAAHYNLAEQMALAAASVQYED